MSNWIYASLAAALLVSRSIAQSPPTEFASDRRPVPPTTPVRAASLRAARPGRAADARADTSSKKRRVTDRSSYRAANRQRVQPRDRAGSSAASERPWPTLIAPMHSVCRHYPRAALTFDTMESIRTARENCSPSRGPICSKGEGRLCESIRPKPITSRWWRDDWRMPRLQPQGADQ